MNQSAAKSPFREDHKVSDKSPVHLDVETGRNFLRPFPWLLVSRWMLSPVSSISERPVRKGWRAPIRKGPKGLLCHGNAIIAAGPGVGHRMGPACWGKRESNEGSSPPNRPEQFLQVTSGHCSSSQDAAKAVLSGKSVALNAYVIN